MIQVRHAESADADAISVLSAEVQAHHARALPHLFKPPSHADFPASSVAALLDDPDWMLLVACAGGVVVGYASARIERRPETPFRRPQTALTIHWMGVTEEWRRRGVGRALMQTLHDAAAEHHVDTMLLDVWASNTDAESFYRAMGFLPQRLFLVRPMR